MRRRQRVEDPAGQGNRIGQRLCPEHAQVLGSAVTRHAFLRRALALMLGSSPALALLGGCGEGGDGGMGDGMMDDGMPEWMMSRDGMDPQLRRHMRVIHTLLREYEEISREVERIAGGIRATTVSARPEVAELVRTHVRQMTERVEAGEPIRQMDPVFREIFEHHTKIEMEIDEIQEGSV